MRIITTIRSLVAALTAPLEFPNFPVLWDQFLYHAASLKSFSQLHELGLSLSKTDLRTLAVLFKRCLIFVGRFVWWAVAAEPLLKLTKRYMVALMVLYVVLGSKRLLQHIGLIIFRKVQKFVFKVVGMEARLQRLNKIEQFELAQSRATSYKQWAAATQQLDALQGKLIWKSDPFSPFYDHARIAGSLHALRQLVDKRDVCGLMTFLRSNLRRNLHGIDNPALYANLQLGTKALIEDYVAEVCEAINCVCEVEDPSVDSMTILTFLSETRHAYGRSAFMFSGGGTLGLYHTGVLKVLHEEGLLPKILSGSSAGAIFASIAGSKTDEELKAMFANYADSLDLAFFNPEGKPEFVSARLKRFFTKGHLMDIKCLQDALRRNLGDWTFEEAYDRTGRIINVSVSPSLSSFDSMMLLNYLTAPKVLLWSAASASCAIPGIFGPVELMAKNDKGEIVPYHTKGVSWIDGSFFHDLPKQKIAEMFNVDHFLVSQVNPHTLPFIYPNIRESTGILPDLMRLILTHFRSFCANVLSLNLYVLRPLALLRPILNQTYRGDITFVPEGWKWSDYLSVLSNPTKEAFRQKCLISEKSCYQTLPCVVGHCAVEFTLDQCLKSMRALIKQREAAGQQPQGPLPISRIVSFVAPAQRKAKGFRRRSGSSNGLSASCHGSNSKLEDETAEFSPQPRRGSFLAPLPRAKSLANFFQQGFDEDGSERVERHSPSTEWQRRNTRCTSTQALAALAPDLNSLDEALRDSDSDNDIYDNPDPGELLGSKDDEPVEKRPNFVRRNFSMAELAQDPDILPQ